MNHNERNAAMEVRIQPVCRSGVVFCIHNLSAFNFYTKAVSKHVYEAVEFEYPHKHKLRAAKPGFLEEAVL